MNKQDLINSFDKRKFKWIKFGGKYTIPNVVVDFINDHYVRGIDETDKKYPLRFIVSISTFETTVIKEGEFQMEEEDG
jgi:hypothetical protein